MDLRHYLAILWRRKLTITITVVVTEIFVVIGTLLIVPIYSTTTTIRIASASSGSISSTDYMYADRLMNTYVKLATTIPVLDELKQRIGLSKLPTIKVNTVPNTELIQITVEHSNPITASLIANSLAEILISQSRELYTGSEESSLEIISKQLSSMEEEVNQARNEYMDMVTKNPEDEEGIQNAQQMLDLKQQMYATILSQYEQTRLRESLRAKMISVVEPAIPPEKPAKPSKIINIALGFLVGVVGGLGLVFLVENLDTTLFTTEQIETITNLPSIGKVPLLKKRELILGLRTNFAAEESFRLLRTNIRSLEFPVRSILVTSAEPKEGKSTITAHLAYTIAQSGLKVVVVDADLRIPAQHKLFNINNNIGLSSVIEQGTNLLVATQYTKYQSIRVLTSGPIPTNPSELIESPQLKDIIKQLSETFDMVIIDTPALLAVSDAMALAPLVDMVAFVICRFKTSSKAVQNIQTRLELVKSKWIGVIINQAEEKFHYYYNKKKTFNGI